MPIVVVTRTRMARARYLTPFAWGSLRAGLQARRSQGYVAGALGVARGPEFWTVTVWESGRAMTAFRNSGAHSEAMPKLAGWASEGTFTAWRTDAETVPNWAEARARIEGSPRFTPLDAPSAEHAAEVVRPAPRRGVLFPLPASRTRVRVVRN